MTAPAQPSPVQPSLKAAVRFFLDLGRPEIRMYGAAFALIFIANLGEIYWVRLTARAVEDAVHGDSVTLLALMIIAVSVVLFFLKWSHRMCTFIAARRIERVVRARAFAASLDMTQEAMDGHRTGDLVSRIINDVSDLRMVLGSGFLQLSNNLFAYSTTLIAMLFLVPRLAAATLLPFVPIVFIAQRLSAVTHARSRRSQDALGTLSAAVEETVGGVEVLKSYNALGWQERRFAGVNDAHYASEVARSGPESLFIGLMSSVVWVGIAAIMLAAGAIISMDALHQAIPIGDIATFIFLFAKLVWPTIALGWIMNVIQRGLAAAGRLAPLLASDRRAGETGNQATPSLSITYAAAVDGAKEAPKESPRGVGAAVRFENVSYRYPTRTSASLQHVDLVIEPGQWVGIVGPTAGGKTTLARLLCGLRRPTEGRVLIGQRESATLTERERRETVHLATQVPTLFSRSIGQNLRLAALMPVSDEEVRSVIKDAAFGTDLDEMPEGIETTIGERGMLLSGGQRQRLSLARAFLCDPEVLVLDDILSAVDLHTEIAILDGIRRRRASRTTILITHRFRVLAQLDRVLVVEHGGIMADGPLSVALTQSAWLRDAFEAEQLRSALDDDGDTKIGGEIVEEARA